MAEIVLSEDGPTENSPSQETTKGFRVFALALSLIGILLAYAGIQRTQLFWPYVASTSGLIISLFLWWILNADSAKWHDRPTEPITAAGGTTAVQLEGSTAGLTV